MKNNKTETVQVVKSVNEELKQATFVVMVPDEVDLHGDVRQQPSSLLRITVVQLILYLEINLC